MASDLEACEAALKAANVSGPPRVAWIKNTLELQELLVSEAVLQEIGDIPGLEIDGEPAALATDQHGSFVRDGDRVLLESEAKVSSGR